MKMIFDIPFPTQRVSARQGSPKDGFAFRYRPSYPTYGIMTRLAGNVEADGLLMGGRSESKRKTGSPRNLVNTVKQGMTPVDLFHGIESVPGDSG